MLAYVYLSRLSNFFCPSCRRHKRKETDEERRERKERERRERKERERREREAAVKAEVKEEEEEEVKEEPMEEEEQEDNEQEPMEASSEEEERNSVSLTINCSMVRSACHFPPRNQLLEDLLPKSECKCTTCTVHTGSIVATARYFNFAQDNFTKGAYYRSSSTLTYLLLKSS